MQRIAGLLAVLFFLSAPVAAQDRPVVVELFTSQGCSSCPPADAFLHTLADRDDVVALAMHVDYWDYIGWKDSFAHPAFAERQRAYARAGGRSMVYTPQMIINGRDHVVGNRPMDATDLIDKHRAALARVSLEARKADGKLRINATAEGLRDRMTVRVLRYRPQSTVAIKRGENAGRTLKYSNVVTEMKVLTEWNPKQPLQAETPISGDLPVVVLIQGKSHGPIEAVARIR